MITPEIGNILTCTPLIIKDCLQFRRQDEPARVCSSHPEVKDYHRVAEALHCRLASKEMNTQPATLASGEDIVSK